MINEIKERGYTLVDESQYKNLNSQLDLLCVNGHKIQATLKEIRKVSFKCEKCQVAQFKNNSSSNKKSNKILSLDAATYSLGLAIFDGTQLIYHENVKAAGSRLSKRLVKITDRIIELINIYKIDKVILEDIQMTSGKFKTFLALASLQGALLLVCEKKKVKFELINVNTWRSGMGIKKSNRTESKRLAIQKAYQLFNVRTNDDVAEAILLGAFYVGEDVLF